MDVPLAFTFYPLRDSDERGWDTNSNQCVIDYLIFKFSKTKGLIKAMKRENIRKEL